MSRCWSPKLFAYSLIVSASLVAALAARAPALLLLGAPFALFVLLGLAAVHPREPTLRASLKPERLLEGELAVLSVEVDSEDPVDWLELSCDPPPGLSTEARRTTRRERTSGAGVRLELDLRAERWGAYDAGHVVVRRRDRFGLFETSTSLQTGSTLIVYPTAEEIVRAVPPLRTVALTGSHTARRAGSGIELADLRPYQPGDPLRHVHWRASARRGELVLAQRHPEESSDVVIFLDTFSDEGPLASGTLARSVRAAASIATAYLELHDRVGIVAFGGVLRWLLPGAGVRQRYRIVDTLLRSQAWFSYAWKEVEAIPPRVLPSGALVVAISPLLDGRTQAALLDLRRRGFDIVIVEVEPDRVDEQNDELDELVARLIELRRTALRTRYRRAGIAVGVWSPDDVLDRALWEVITSRRGARTTAVR